MNTKIKVLIFFLILISINSYSQLSINDVAENFTLTDLNGNTHTLYDYLDDDKSVVLDFFGTTCDPCWNYHNSHTLDSIYEKYGPNGTNEMMVFQIESNSYTPDTALYGVGDGTRGDWVTGTHFATINLDSSTIDLLTEYKVVGLPIIYVICPDRLINHVDLGAQNSSESTLYSKNQQCGRQEYNNNAKLLEYEKPNDIICDNFTPKIKVINYGSNDLTSFNIIAKINTDTVINYIWTGNLNTYNIAQITLPEVDISLYDDGNYNFSYEIISVNNTIDEDTTNNKIEKLFTIKTENIFPAQLYITPDLFPSQVNWLLKKGNSTILTGNNYDNKIDTNIVEELCLEENACYKFIIYDLLNNGFTQNSGSVKLICMGSELFSFTEEEHNSASYTVDFCADTSSNVTNINIHTFKIYPNPAGNYINISNIISNKNIQVNIINITGKAIISTCINKNKSTINISNLKKGIYLIRIEEQVFKFIKK